MINKRILTVGLALPLYDKVISLRQDSTQAETYSRRRVEGRIAEVLSRFARQSFNAQDNKSSLILSLEPSTARRKFLLSPISYERTANPEQQTTQWYLKFTGSLKIKLNLRWQTSIWQRSGLVLTYTEENPLTLILEEGKATVPWTLRQGSIQVPLTLTAPKDSNLQSLWPTGDIKQISALVVQSGGLYLQGKLPPLFYPDPDTPQPVLLRIPQTKDDTNEQSNLGKVSTYFWTLDALPFDQNHTVVDQIQGFAKHLADFRLTEAKRRLQTFIDDVDCYPDAQSRIQIFQIIGKPTDPFIRKLTWLTLRPNTRITLGGQGTAEASFTPKVLYGQLLQKKAPQEWELEFIEWRAQSDPVTTTDINFSLELSQIQSNPTVTLKETNVQALSLPVGRFISDENRYRAWMCLTDGWLGVDTSAREAIVDPKKATQGAILGVLELTPLLQGLQENSRDGDNASSGLMVQLQTLASPNDRSGDRPVILRWSKSKTDIKLSLHIQEPMVVLMTPAVWYRETADNTVEPAWEQNFIPTLIAQTDNPDDLNNPDRLLKQRLGQGIFVSENVVQPSFASSDDRNQGIPVKGVINYEEQSQSFRLRLSHGTVGKVTDRDGQEKTLKQDILVWYRPLNYPVVQSFPLSSTRNTGSFLDSNRGLIPYRFSKDAMIAVKFPMQGLPRLLESPVAQDKPISPATDWRLVASLLTSRYFLPTLPGIEIKLNPEPLTWLYRHSVPVLDEAYAEVQESESEQIADTGNVQGRDFTRVAGTEAFNIVPTSTQATGWLHKTATNPTGEIQIEFPANEQVRLQKLQGRSPELEFKLKDLNYTFVLNRDRFDPEGKIPKTSGGLTLPLKVEATPVPSFSLPEFKINPHPPDPDNQLFGILNEGQPLLAKFVQGRIVISDAEGLVQEEVIGEINSYKLLQEPEQRRCTRSFKLLNKMTLEARGIRLGKLPKTTLTDDLQQQSWMVHDGQGGWPTLGGFPIYPLRLAELQENNGQYTIEIEGIWLPSTPIDRILSNNASQRLTLTFAGHEGSWKMVVKGGIDWFLKSSKEDEDTDSSRLVQLQAEINQLFTISEEFEFKNLNLAVVFPLGLLELEIEKQVNQKTKATISEPGKLKIQFPTLGSGELDQQYEIMDLLAFNLGTIIIEVDKFQDQISSYEFRWLPQGLLVANNGVDKSFLLKTPGLSDQKVQLTAKVIQRRAFFKNEFGLFWVDEPITGSINTLTPDQPGYAKAALERQLLIVTPEDKEKSELLSSQKWITGYLIQNGNTQDFLANNPTNDPSKRPVAFFPFTEANPDRQEHLQSQRIPQGIQLAWEDGRSGGDKDFDDLVISITLPLFWQLSLISSGASQKPQWELEIGKEDDLPLIALPLTLYPLGAKKFILATRRQATVDELQQQPFFLPQREPESAIVALEVDEKASIFYNLIADVQLRLKDDQTEPETHLIVRLLLNLLQTGSVKVLEDAEITGQWVLQNNLPFKTETAQTSECHHQVTFYCDRAKVSTFEIFSLLRGRGPSEAISIGAIAEHKITVKEKGYIWQAAQTLGLTTLGQVADTFLGTVERLDSKRIRFAVDSAQVTSVSSNSKVLNETLEYLQNNLECTAKLEGFTSADGDRDSNQILSEQRAEAVKQWLIERGIDPARLTAQGLGAIASGDVNQNRRADITIYTTNRPVIRPEQLPSLVIEAGAVFELSQGNLLPSPTDATADIDNFSLRLLIRSLLRDETGPAYILRLPFVSSFNSDVPNDLWSAITLTEQPEQPIFKDQRSYRSLEPPPIKFSSTLSSVDIFKRTEQAQWLNSEAIKNFLSFAEVGSSNAIQLKPVFVDKEGQLTFRFPDTLGDFGPFLKLEPLPGQMTFTLKASTLLIAFSGLMLEPSYLTVFNYPFEVTSLDSMSSGESKINLQLVSFIGGRLQQLSQDMVKSDTEIFQWGKQRLEAKRRYEAAIVWQNFDNAVASIPRPFDIVQQDQDDYPQATALTSETPTAQPYGQEIDPRCHLPELIENNSFLALDAEPNMGLVVFEATPLIQNNAKSVAATRFRLAATGIESSDTNTQMAWAGKLRPPQISPVDSRQLLGCNKWDQVNFEQVLTLHYPSVTPQSINQPSLPLSKSLLEISFPSKEGRTLVPPLVDVVAWAARPGETTRSLWSLEKLTYQARLHQQAGTHPVSTSLRRSRGVAAPDESVRLDTLNDLILNQQFFYASLQLTRVLGTTPLPSIGAIYGVAVSKRNFYPSQPDLRRAATSPALFYYKKENPEKINLESLELFAIADRRFEAKVRKLDGDEKLVTQTALLWSDSMEVPKWQPAQRETNLDKVLVEDLSNPSNSPWEKLFKMTESEDDNTTESEEPNIFDVRRINFDAILRPDIGKSNLKQWLEDIYLKAHSNQPIYFMLVQYKVKNPEKPENDWEWDKGNILWSTSLAFLDQKSSIIAPKMGIALLTAPNQVDANNKIRNNTVLSGYGRLDESDFSPIQPFATEKSVAIDWIRIAGLKTLERIDTYNLGTPPYEYDVVVYGSGGELIPIEGKEISE